MPVSSVKIKIIADPFPEPETAKKACMHVPVNSA